MNGFKAQVDRVALSALAGRRKTLSLLLDVRPNLPPRSAVFDLSCCEFHRELDDYTVALTEAEPADFASLSAFLTDMPTTSPDRPWFFAAAGDLLTGPVEARRRLSLLDHKANQQLLDQT